MLRTRNQLVCGAACFGPAADSGLTGSLSVSDATRKRWQSYERHREPTDGRPARTTR